MRGLLYQYCLFLGFFMYSFNLHGQDASPILITENYQNENLKTILQDLQKDYKVRFFYKDSEMPEQGLTMDAQEEEIGSFLNKLLKSTPLGHYTYRNNGIIILPRVDMETDYTSDYYAVYDEIQSPTQNSREDEAKEEVVGDISTLDAAGMALIKGRVWDEETRDPIIGATVLWVDTDISTITDVNGKFEMKVPSGSRELLLQYIGYQNFRKIYNIQGEASLRLRMEKEAINLDEVTISARSVDENVEKAQISVTTLSVSEIKKLPTFMGEADIVKSLLLQPGVSTMGEGASGFNVRGGDVDQNLVMQDEAFFFNSSHALGFFSSFNTDMVNSVDLYKGNIPSQFGGRLASVMDVKMKNGNNQRWRLKGGVGPVTGRVSVDGPIGDKITLNSGFRSSYSNWLLNLVNVQEVKNSSSFFYDANVRLNVKFDEKTNLTLSGYSSSDEFIYNNEFGFNYQTMFGQLGFNSTISDNLLNQFSAVYSQYNSSQQAFLGFEGAEIDNQISYIKLKDQLSFTTDNDSSFDLGLSGIYYFVEPGTRAPLGIESQVIPKTVEDDQGLEMAAFANAEIPIGESLVVTGGLRLSYYQFRGPKTVYQYANPEAPNFLESFEPINYGSGDVIASYFSPEPRLSLRLKLSESASFKTGYSRTAQYVNQIFNSDSPTPSSQWQLANTYIKPHRSHNLSAGYFRNFSDDNWETSFEVYGRYIDQLYDYRDFAELFVNDHIETELLKGEGRSYGAELSIKKKKGLWHGWLSYTFSRAERLIDGINNGNYYPSNFDKPHDLSLVLNYQPNQRNTLTVNFNYATGRPTTAPVGNFITNTGLFVPIYTERNQLRIPAYHRIDVAYTLGKGWKKNKRFQSSWTISVYNLYGRRNAFSVFYDQTGRRKAIANKLSILGYAFPSITFNFEII